MLKAAPFRGVPMRRPVPRTPPTAFNPDIFKMVDELRTMHTRLDGGIKLVEQVLKTFEQVKQGNPGKPGHPGVDGKNVTDVQVRAAVRALYVQPKDGVSPTIDEIMATLLQSKKLIRLIQGNMTPGKDGIAPKAEEVVAMVFAEMEKMGISLKSLKSIETRMAEVRNHVATNTGMRGGGDTIVAGTGVTITNTVNGNKRISASGSGASLTRETPVGAVDGSNTIFTVAHTPVFVLIDRLNSVDGYGYTYAAPTITVDPLAPPVQAIFSFYNA